LQGEEGVDYHYGSVEDVDPREWQVPPHCVPIHANVTTYDWREMYEASQFDVIMMDPPWQLATANPTRGPFPDFPYPGRVKPSLQFIL
jgi:mRNA (2'-O-methyladenosine-N6-)-methyltransferase